ncbi:MAG: hypothetical protein HY718_03200 [Planctomycetes bacterium]|nr:hypothetical protein [Planctomycetota bacterium]
MEERAADLFLTDDAAARMAAESLGFAVHGSIGLIIRSIRTGTRRPQQVIRILREIPQKSTLHISPSLLSHVIAEVEEQETA